MSNHATAYGNVYVSEQGVSIDAHSGQLYEWAHRPGQSWPCSILDDLESVHVHFDFHGLVDMVQSPDPTEDGDYEVPSDELSAWSSDVLREVLPEDHPAYFVTVGQFS